uniref:Uncharacterized protein n=1 Tax=Romanomermis culicivorax TaxID=13658 RepID=A0A915HWV3_ROMCU
MIGRHTNWLQTYVPGSLAKDGSRSGMPFIQSNCGLATLTSTPLNCGPSIKKLLKRPENEKFLLLLPIGYPHEQCSVPQLERKKLTDIMHLL